MKETADDIQALERLLDRSYRAAGEHLRAVHEEGRRVGAAELARRLTGMRLLVVATVTADGRPLTGPVDGIFHRGAFHFSTDPKAVRARHLAARPVVSATHLPTEEFAVTVHGRAVPADIVDPSPDGFRATLLEIYTPRYGEDWEQFLESGVVSWRIEPDRMFAIDAGAAG